MSKQTDYKGIDYGLGQSNRDIVTGIRFGVIAGNALNPEALDDIYQCGTDLDYEAYIDDVKGKLANALSDYFSDYKHEGKEQSRLDEAVEMAFDAISDRLGDSYQESGDCVRMLYEKDGYKIQAASDGDIWVLKSPYFTYAQFCSPCAPGACYLANALTEPDANNKCYCLNHDWFDDAKAPYPVYAVESATLIPQD